MKAAVGQLFRKYTIQHCVAEGKCVGGGALARRNSTVLGSEANTLAEEQHGPHKQLGPLIALQARVSAALQALDKSGEGQERSSGQSESEGVLRENRDGPQLAD